MRNSLFHKFLLFFILGCIISPLIMGQKKAVVSGSVPGMSSAFDTSFEKGLYKGSLDISKHHISGLFFLKRFSANDIRIVFSNEMGMNFFDVELKQNEFIVHSCFPSLNREALLKLLENDFRLLLFTDTTIFKIKQGRSKDPELNVFGVRSAMGSFHYTLDKDSGKVRRIQTSRSILGRTDLRVYGDNPRQPSKVHIMNATIRLHLHMVSLNK